MHSKAKPPTQAERTRWLNCARRVGCIACRQLPDEPYREPDQHHLLSGGRRLGHGHTVPLCEWHHRGETGLWRGARACAEIYGPSLARAPRAFRERFGSDEQLIMLTEDWLRRTSSVAAGAKPTD